MVYQEEESQGVVYQGEESQGLVYQEEESQGVACQVGVFQVELSQGEVS